RQPQKLKIQLADGKEREIQHTLATSFWSPDGKPLSAAEFIKGLFGTLPELFQDENQLRELWSSPDTRQNLLDSLTERGYSGEDLLKISRIIDAEKSDIYDVLAYIAYATPPITRSQRVLAQKRLIFSHYDDKQQEFLEFVLEQYMKEGVQELREDKLGSLLELKYHGLRDAVAQLGKVGDIRQVFISFQQYLYKAS
ncbi:type I restriction-modification enzyme R subunit C-terminal domain-containing protein, partial [Limnoraphis robusta]|nr:type I restriction-modification enzyme R subunit C-terminal domain-containing protein [Limnoraphis robusta]